MNVPLTLLVLNSLFASASLQAAVVGYWRFEDGAFMDDSSGNGYHLVTNTDTAQVTLPATGNGSAYPTTILDHDAWRDGDLGGNPAETPGLMIRAKGFR